MITKKKTELILKFL